MTGGVGADAVARPPERVLLVHERYQQRGGEDVVVDAQAALLAAAGHVVERLDVDNTAIPAGDGLPGRLRLAGNTFWSRGGVRIVREAVDRFRPDVVHVHNTFPLLSPAVLGAARDAGPAIVQTLHNFRLVCPNGLLFRDGRPCEDCVGLPLALPGVVHGCYRGSRAGSAVVAGMLAVHRGRGTWRRDVDRFVVLAEFARDRLARGGVPRSRISVVPNFAQPDGPPADGPGEGLLFVGRLSPEKGLGTLLEAWRGAAIDGSLRIAGDGPLAPDVRAAAEGDPRIVPLGRLEAGAIRDEMRRARALVVPSTTYENCPMTVIEAYAVGRPVIASGHGGLGELVEDGETGLRVRPGDAAGLRAALERASNGPADMLAMGRAARARFEARYAPEAAYGALRAVYRQAALRRRAAGAA